MATSNLELYELDFVEWTRATAAAIRDGDLNSTASKAVAEETEDLGKRDYSEVASRTEFIISHLLKWQFQPERRSVSWRVTIDAQRSSLARKFEQRPSLKRRLEEALPALYQDGVLGAVAETGMAEGAVGIGCCRLIMDRRKVIAGRATTARQISTSLASQRKSAAFALAQGLLPSTGPESAATAARRLSQEANSFLDLFWILDVIYYIHSVEGLRKSAIPPSSCPPARSPNTFQQTHEETFLMYCVTSGAAVPCARVNPSSPLLLLPPTATSDVSLTNMCARESESAFFNFNTGVVYVNS